MICNMSREIKFRGWDATGQKGWVYGDLVHNQKVTKIGLEPRTMVGGYEVDPESIGQFTGMCTKDNKPIYEGDVVEVSYEGRHLFDATIVWIDKYAGFYMDEDDEKCFSPIPQNIVMTIGNRYERDRQGFKTAGAV